MSFELVYTNRRWSVCLTLQHHKAWYVAAELCMDDRSTICGKIAAWFCATVHLQLCCLKSEKEIYTGQSQEPLITVHDNVKLQTLSKVNFQRLEHCNHKCL